MKLRICLMYMISATVLMLVVGLAGDREIRLRAGSWRGLTRRPRRRRFCWLSAQMGQKVNGDFELISRAL